MEQDNLRFVDDAIQPALSDVDLIAKHAPVGRGDKETVAFV